MSSNALVQVAPATAPRIADVSRQTAETRIRVQLNLDDAARAWLARRGYDPRMGARPMARLIQEQIKRPLAEELLFGKLAHGGTVQVGVAADGEKLQLQCQPAAQPALTAE